MSIEVKLIPIATIAAPSLVRTTNGHDAESLKGLTASISAHGLLQPIVIRPYSVTESHAHETDAAPTGTFQWTIVAGRRRLAACKMAGLTEVPALTVDTDEAKAYEMEAVENIQREQLSLVDTARCVRMLMMIYDNQRKVCEIVGKSPAWVSKHLAVTSGTCPAVIKDMLDREVITDLETLTYLKSIAEMEASKNATAAVRTTWTRMLRIANEGNMTRVIARDALASLKAPKPAPQRVTLTETGNGQDNDQDDGPSVSQRHIVPPSLIGIDTDPKTAFTIALPIDLLSAFEERGGIAWLEQQLRNSSEG